MSRASSAASPAQSKRRWNERDWDVAMEAQSFVAVFADASPATSEPHEGANDPLPASKGKKKTASKKRKTRKSKKAGAEEEAEPVETTPAAAPSDAFWLAQLQDDVIEDMLDTDASVRVTWLNRVDDAPDGRRYTVAYDDRIDVQTILCGVYLIEVSPTEMELTAKSAARVEKSLRRARGESTPEEDAQESEGEAPPTSSRRRKQRAVHDQGDDDDDDGSGRSRRRRSAGGGGGRRVLRAKMPKKVSKRVAAMHIPPHYTRVDEAKYEDRELLGTHAFDDCSGDALSCNREIMRAVRTQNYELLKQLVEDKPTLKKLYSFHTNQSADVKRTALQYAIEADDVQAVKIMQQAHKVQASSLGKRPSASLPSHSTGSHTSAYSDYNRRAINASRGGREGNNALLEDLESDFSGSETIALWRHPESTVTMLTVLHPAGEWVNDYANPTYVANVVRAGNLALASKMVDVLGKNGGWGYNDLHVVSLSTSDQELPTFRSVSVIKKCQQTKITPLHFAAINPNVKYLEALWENGGSEQGGIRDDAQFEPIHYAAANTSPSAVRFLLERKANLLSRTKAKHTPLMHALLTRREETAIAMLEFVATESEDFIKQVLTSRGPESYQLIHFAAENNCLAVLKHLLGMGVDVNALAAGQTTALSLAARLGHFECVKLLLAHGAKVDRADKLKRTPLLLAVKNGHTRIAAHLINHDANVNAYDSSENSVVHYAASYGWMSCLLLLFDAGADLWSRNSWGFVPLICAMLKMRTVCAEFILKSDNEQRFLDFRDRSGRTMLFLQCQHSRNLEQIVYLLEKGLDPNIGDCDGKKPLEVLIDRAKSTGSGASSSFYLDAVRALVTHGAEVNYKDIDEDGDVTYPRQPLQVAIRNNSRDIFDYFLTEAGADPLIVESADSTDAWLTSASLGQQGEYFLEKLLDKDPTPRAITQRTDWGNNIFHLIAGTASSKLTSAALVERLLKYCVNAVELMHEKNSSDVTPLMALYQARPSLSKNAREKEIAERKQQDEVFSKVARLFARLITDVEALKQYVWVSEKIDPTNPSTEEENITKVRYLNSTILHTASRCVTSESRSSSSNSRPSGFSCGSSVEAPTSGFGSGFVFGSTGSSSGFSFGSGASVTSAGSGFSFGSAAKPTPAKQASPAPISLGENLVELLLEVCAPCKSLVDVPTRTDHETPFLIASGANDLTTTRVLLAAGADPNYVSRRCKNCMTQSARCVDCLSRGLTDTALLKATQCDRLDMMKLLLENGASTDCFAYSTLDTPLHVTMKAGRAEQTRLLLAFGASMVKLNAARSTPLATAISAGFSVDIKKPHEGEIQFSTAALGRGMKAPCTGASPVSMKTTSPSERQAGTVIDVALACPEAIPAILAADENERTPLHHAAAKRDLHLLQALLKPLGADKAAYVNKADAFGRTALHFALNKVSMKPDASFDVERFLILSGANASAVDDFGLSALHFALRKVNMDWHLGYDATLGFVTVKAQKATGEYETKKVAAFARHMNETPSQPVDPVETLSNLIAAGCDALASDGLGRSPLHLASSIGAFVCVSTLLSSCPPSRRQQMLEQQDVAGFTPLGRAFEHARETTITTLIQSGAQVSGTVRIRGEERSYFSVAVEKMMSGICHMLLNAGFSRRQAVEDAVCGNQLQLAKNLMVGLEISNDRGLLVSGNSHGETLLHCLARSCIGFDDLAAELAWTLVEDGLDVSAQDVTGNTALHRAAAKSNTRLMDFLLHHGADVNAVNKAGLTPLMAVLRDESRPNRLATLQFMLLRDELDLRQCDSDGFDMLALFHKHFLTEFEKDAALISWFELALRRHGNLNETYASMAAGEKDLFANKKLGESPATTAPLLIWVAYAKSMTTRCELLRALLHHGASPSATDSHGNSVLMHLVARNMFQEASLVLQDAKVARGQVRALVDTANRQGLTALHLAVEPLEYGSYENLKMIELLVDNGASLSAQDVTGRTPLDYATRQSSRRVFRFLKTRYPKLVKMSEAAAFDDAMDVAQWADAPAFGSDADAYLKACEDAGKIVKTRVAPEVDENCDVGSVSSVFGLLDADGKVIEGEEYNALLTKVDVKHGKHGLNVFYRTQVVHDELQSIYLVFTNWGRIGEEGKFQNTPFHSADEAVAEFKKIFKSKTSNAWEDRHNFEKRAGKYNLVQRVDFSTDIDEDVTRSFTEHIQHLKKEKIDVLTEFAPLVRSELDDKQILNALFAITDVSNLQLAARDYEYDEELPLAREHVLRSAMDMLHEIRAVVTEQAEVRNEITVTSGNLASEDSTAVLSELSDRLAAFTEDLSERSSRYYEIVPRNEDRFGSAIAAFDNIAAVDAEIYRLKRLLEITHTYKMLLGAKLRQKQIHPMEYVVDSLQIQIARLPVENDECVMLTKYFSNGIRPSDRKRYRVSNVFEVARRGEAQRLETCLASDPAFSEQHTTLLWHGTSCKNLMGILSEGLRIAPPEAPHHGYAYGKGIYFSDVAAKSLNYCGYPYKIEEDFEELEGETVTTKTKTRSVQYMLLCQVALGNQRDVRSSSMYNREALGSDGFHSVRAVGQHAPNVNESLVSPSCGAKLPLGRVGRPGRDYERPSAWAVRKIDGGYNAQYSFPTWQFEAEAYVDRTLATKSSWKVGDCVEITQSSDKELFVRKGGYYGNRVEDDVKVELRIAEISVGTGGWDIGVEFVATPPARTEEEGAAGSSTVAVAPVIVGKARRYLNVNFKKLPKLDKDFSMVDLSAAGQYNEHIVYTTEQVRVRYVVEVEVK